MFTYYFCFCNWHHFCLLSFAHVAVLCHWVMHSLPVRYLLAVVIVMAVFTFRCFGRCSFHLSLFWSLQFSPFAVLVVAVFTFRCFGRRSVHLSLFWSLQFSPFAVLVVAVFTFRCFGRCSFHLSLFWSLPAGDLVGRLRLSDES